MTVKTKPDHWLSHCKLLGRTLGEIWPWAETGILKMDALSCFYSLSTNRPWLLYFWISLNLKSSSDISYLQASEILTSRSLKLWDLFFIRLFRRDNRANIWVQLHFLILSTAAPQEPKEVCVLVSKITQIIPCYNAIISGGETLFFTYRHINLTLLPSIL